MVIFRIPCSVPALGAVLLLAGCSSARLDPKEFDYYSSKADTADASARTDYGSAPVGSPLTPRAGDPLPAPVIEPVVPASSPVATASATTHRVQKGESLYSISTRYLGAGKRWKEIADLNGLSDADVKRLPVGKELKIPAR